MFTRFKSNVQRFPRLFKTWLVLSILTVGYYFLPWTLGVVVVVTTLLSLALYLWIFSDAGRTVMFLDIINRFEGTELCTVAAHEPDFDAMYEEERLEENDEEEPL